MKFNAIDQPYQLSRYSVTAKNGMVCSSSALASSAGLEILKKGGNAVDAAIATAAVLTVVEPVSNGLGGDAFAIVWMKEKLHGLNASGYSPKELTIDKLESLGYKEMPKHGWIPVTVPGQPKAWSELSKKFGELSLKEVLEPAIRYAEEGYPVSAVVSYLWNKYVTRDSKEFNNKPEFNEWFKTFTKNGEPYLFGEVVKFPNHAKTLRLIAETNSDAFYKGEIADKIIEQSNRDGGFISKDDLKEYEVEWVEPISINYKGYDVFEIPPNGQGIVALMALNILKNFDFNDRDCVDTVHKQFEAIKMAFQDAYKNVTDAKYMTVDYDYFLSDEYGKKRSNEIGKFAKCPEPIETPKSGTVYLCAADCDGNMISYIQSNYMSFGSGIVIEDYGIALQNRGYDFSLDRNHINALKPRKKSFHTIIPGFLMKDGKPIGPFGVMGGYMQPQGHVQVIMNLIDFNLNPQMCLDAPRWQWKNNLYFDVEPDYPKEVISELRKRGHEIFEAENKYSFGRGEMIIKLSNKVYIGACESRTDGSVACY